MRSDGSRVSGQRSTTSASVKIRSRISFSMGTKTPGPPILNWISPETASSASRSDSASTRRRFMRQRSRFSGSSVACFAVENREL